MSSKKPSLHAGGHPDHGFGMPLEGLSHSHDGPQAATTGTGGSPDGDSYGHSEMDVEAGSSHFRGGILAGGMDLVAPVAVGEAGPRVGDNHQAVIPCLSTIAGDGKFIFYFVVERVWYC